jgi:hypothetical protein
MQTAVFTAVGFLPSAEEKGRGSSEGDDELYEALQGRGIRPRSQTGSVVILNSGGIAVGRMMTRRMLNLCDSLVAERWRQSTEGSQTEAKRPKRSLVKEEETGLFREDSRSSLKEAQQMARTRLNNIKLCSPTDYESLDHILVYILPALIEDIRQHGRAPLSLIILDDLPSLLIEEGVSTSQKEFTLRRSRIVCEIADRLKRLAMAGGELVTSAAAIMVMNQVVDAMARNKVFLPLLLPKAWTNHQRPDGSPPLSSAFQDGYFNGILASADIKTLTEARIDFANGRDEEEAISRVSATSKVAALGYSWVNCINVRIMLTRTRKTVRRNGNDKLAVRRAVCVINPFAKAGQGWDPHVEYVVLPEGVRSLSTLPPEAILPTGSLDEEDALWSSFDADFKPNDTEEVVDSIEQARLDIEDEYLWALGSDLDDDLELP